MRFVAVQKARKPPRSSNPTPKQSYEPLHRIADRLAPIIERKLRISIEEFRSKVDVRDILAALESGNVGRVEGVIPWGELLDKYEDFRDDIQQAVNEAGFATDAQLRAYLVTNAQVPQADLSFNKRNPEAEKWAAERSSSLIKDLTKESRQAVRNVIRETLQTGQDYGKSAQKIKDAVGLNQVQAGAVARYRDGLVSSGVRPATVERLVGQYRETSLKARAETISRTETISAVNQGQQAYWQQLADEGVIDPERAKKVWVVTPDDRLCPLCEPLAGMIVGIDENFKTELGDIDAPPLHPNCRCAISLDI